MADERFGVFAKLLGAAQHLLDSELEFFDQLQFAFYLAAMQWMRVADPRMYATWICLSFYCSFFSLLTVYLIRFLDRRTPLPLVLTLPIAWTAVEYLRSTLFGGFSSGSFSLK